MNQSLLFRHLRPAVIALLALVASCSREATAPSSPPPSPYAAVARGQVTIEGGLLQLGAPRDGTLAGVDVREGDRVSKGQTLATLDGEPAQLAIDAAKAALSQAQAQQQLFAAKLKLARQQAHRLSEAARQGAGDGQSADEARSSVVTLLAQGDAAAAAVEMARQKLVSARYELGLRTLKAPMAAIVVRVAAQPGASVTPAGPPLFTLLPDVPREVRAEVNNSFADSLKVGMSARVSLDDHPDGRALDARVTRIGQVVGPSKLDTDPLQRANDRTVVCVLAFDQPQTLRIGQRVLVRFASAAPAQAGSSAKAR